MGKGSGHTKKAVLAFSKARMPKDLVDPASKPRLSFKECKRRSILAGLRAFRAPTVSWQNGGPVKK